MRERILNKLRECSEKPISGEELAEQLQVSRTAVWKQIQQLKKDGYNIESVTAKGYVLRETPDRLFPREIERYLETQWLARSVCYEESVPSTNNLAKQLANKEVVHGLLVVAEEQGAGKGRVGRGWSSPYGKGLWFSVVFQPKFLPQEAPKCTLMAAVAVTEAIREIADAKVEIKWPNDILFNGKKMVGILSEMSAEFGHINYVVVGIGIDTHVEKNDLPVDVQNIFVSLDQVAKKSFTRVELLGKIMNKLEVVFEEAEKKGFADIFAKWREYSCTLGKEVKVIGLDETYYGKAVDIDNSGMLLVKKTDGKIEKVLAGDVSIRPVE